MSDPEACKPGRSGLPEGSSQAAGCGQRHQHHAFGHGRYQGVHLDEMMKVLSSDEETYRRLTADRYDHGKVLRDDKISWLYWSFTMFRVGMLVTAIAVVLDLTGILEF